LAYGEFVGVETLQPLVMVNGIFSIELTELVVGSTSVIALVI
jgi:hypothetical protein